MTVKEMKDLLDKLPDDMEIYREDTYNSWAPVQEVLDECKVFRFDARTAKQVVLIR